uniref:Permease n=1 Tax=Solibacter usitatus (strain Ellin6076) TaxID=234267 RepID=Q028A3_SOLUE
MLWSDARFAVRQIRKSPGFALTVILTLALCIGVNTAVFSVLDAVLLRPVPYPQPERLALVVTASRSGGAEYVNTSQTGALFESVRDRATGLDAAADAGIGGANFSAPGRLEYIQQHRVSSGFFRVLGVAPHLGREFTREEDVPGGPALAILSDAFWRRAFNGDPTILGKAIQLKGEDHIVIGVMSHEFRTTAPVDVWTPLHPSRRGEGGGSNYEVIARLAPGVTWTAANDQLRALSAALRDDPAFPREVKDFEERVTPLQAGITGDSRKELLLTWGAVLMVLLIGCVNIAGLLLARSGSRAREIATRMALGGNRGTIVRQLLIESVMLALAGGVAGVAFGGLALDWLKKLGADKNELWHPIVLDARVLGVMLGIALFTSLLFGLAPALQTTRLDIRTVLMEAGRGIAGPRRRWTRTALVIAEVALSLVMLVGAGLLVRTLAWLNGLNPGFDPRNVVAAEASLQDARYHSAANLNLLYTRTLERIRRIPGVDSAAVALTLPYERPLNNGFRMVESDDHEPHGGEFVYSTPAYFETMRIPVVAGRALRDSDTPQSARVVVVSESFARKYFHGDALGRHLRSGKDVSEIVGVCGDVQQHSGLSGKEGPLSIEPTIYLPASQLSDGFVTLIHTWFSPKWVVRTNGPTANPASQIRAAVAATDPQLPVAHFRTVDELRGRYTGSQRYMAGLFSTLAGLALLLAAVGLYGLISQSVTQRRHELGIRMALGATAQQTILGVMRPGLLMALAGAGAGLALSVVLVRFLRSMLWGVRETDPATFVLMAVLLLVVAVLASLAPALRILRMDPAETLRSE